jgi:glycosyltransferase involved in cell wall biosynthesis
MQDGVYAATDVFCLASRWQEAFGWVLAEAMVFEKPVVATRVGGIPEVVEDGRTGLLAAPGDVAGLADRLIRLLNDPALRLRMGQAGRKTAAEKFDLRRTVAEVLSLYRL